MHHTWYGDLQYGFILALFIWLTICELKRPGIKREDIIYEERFRSGYRTANLWTRLGGARNCLKLIFLKDRLIVRAHFPFSIIARLYGLDLEIPYEQITSVSIRRIFFQKCISLEFKSLHGNDGVVFIPSDYPKVMKLLHGAEGKD